MRKLKVLLISGAICLLGVAPVLAQGQYSTLAEYEKTTGKRITKLNEAPMLRTMVAAGELPSVEERVSKEPLVIKPLEEIGQYGGTLHMVSIHADSLLGPHVIFRSDVPLRPDPDCRTIVANVVKDWKLSKDGKDVTLYLRKGMKWSDGYPFTTDDVMYWYEDVLQNKDITPIIGLDWRPGEKLVEIKKIDDYTVNFHFAVPNPLVIIKLAHGMDFYTPKHYLKQFHPRYTPMEKLQEMAKKEGYDHWYQLYTYVARYEWGMPMSHELPTINAYVLEERTSDHLTFKRNPYYWKIDTAGNQLPYIDRYYIDFIGNIETANARIITGDIDFDGFVTKLENLPLYKDNAERGDYRILMYDSAFGTEVMIQINMTIEDPVLRKIFQDVRFRRAMSLAIDREELNDTLYFGLGEPRQTTVIPECSSYVAEYAKAYAQYDPEEANRLLDEMGLKWDPTHKYRLRPDGKPLAVTVEYCESDTAKTPTWEMVKTYWEDVGVPTTLKLETNTLESQRAVANQIQVGCHHADRSTDLLFYTEPYWYVGITNRGWENTRMSAWATWYVTGGEGGEKPSEEQLRLLDIRNRMQATMDEKERIELGKELLRSQAENLWTIGTVGRTPYVVVVKNNLRNVPETGLYSWDTLFGYPYKSEQFFFKGK